MKLLFLCASVIFLCGCVSSNKPIIYAQLYAENSEYNKLENFKHIGTDFVEESLWDDTHSADVVIHGNGIVVTQIGGSEFPPDIGTRGQLIDCKGYKDKCFEVDTFELMLPEDFDFETTMIWNWGEYKYETFSNRKLSILGKDYDAVEIIGVKEKAPYQVVHFYVSKDIGLIYFILRLEDYRAAYFLSSEKGVWN